MPPCLTAAVQNAFASCKAIIKSGVQTGESSYLSDERISCLVTWYPMQHRQCVNAVGVEVCNIASMHAAVAFSILLAFGLLLHCIMHHCHGQICTAILAMRISLQIQQEQQPQEREGFPSSG